MDAEKPSESKERPREVIYAIRLTIASLVLAIIAFPLRRPEAMKSHLIIVGIFGIFLTLSLTVFLIFMILRGQNWARLLYINLFFLGLPFAVPAFLLTLSKNPIAAFADLLQLSLQMMTVVLLLQKPTRDWFRFIKVQKLMNYQVT
jgi:hypothetical protein